MTFDVLAVPGNVAGKTGCLQGGASLVMFDARPNTKQYSVSSYCDWSREITSDPSAILVDNYEYVHILGHKDICRNARQNTTLDSASRFNPRSLFLFMAVYIWVAFQASCYLSRITVTLFCWL